MYLLVQHLPQSLRFRPENILIVSTIPGPKEPSCADLNPYLTCMVNDLLKLWEGVWMQMSRYTLSTGLIKAVLVYISSDLPATRKGCGFYGIKAMRGCSKCLKCRQTFKWEPRNSYTHLEQANRANAATTRLARETIEREYAIHYSELLELPYFDVV